MRFLIGFFIGSLIGCVSLLKEHRFSLNQLSLKEHVLALNEEGKLICSSADLLIDKDGKFFGSNEKEGEGEDCLKAPVFAYSVEDRAKLEAYIESAVKAYYGQ